MSPLLHTHLKPPPSSGYSLIRQNFGIIFVKGLISEGAIWWSQNKGIATFTVFTKI